MMHDPGPPSAWQQLFADAPLDAIIDHPSRRFRLHFGPVFYRGRLDGTARVLVIGQDPGTDELLAHRALVGHSGQRVQRLLGRIGVTRSYLMMNTFIYGIFGQIDAQMREIAMEPAIETWRNRAFDAAKADNRLEAIIAFGAGARFAVQRWPGAASLRLFTLTHPSAEEADVIADWNRDLDGLAAAITPDADGTVTLAPYATMGPEEASDIPRFDLPFGVPNWHGTGGGTRSVRDGNARLIWTAPEPGTA